MATTTTETAAAKAGSRRAQRGAATRELLLDAAERLIGERGIDGISMRQLGAAVGQGNNSVIQYHFASKEGLIREIVGRRGRELAPMRDVMLAQARAEGRTGDVATLLKILLLPIASFKDDAGRHVYAAFMLHGLRAMWGADEGIGNAFWSGEGAISEAIALLGKQRPDLGTDALARRLLRLSRFFVTSLVDWDKLNELGRSTDSEAYFLDDLFNMMTAAFLAPPPDPPTTTDNP